MALLTFSFEDIDKGGHVKLFPLEDQAVSQQAWEELAQNVAQEKGLRPSSAGALAERWQRGRAAAAVKEGHIISYISLVSIFNHDIRCQLGPKLSVSPAQLPGIDMYGSSTGWTHPEWRRRGISLQLRQPLLKRFCSPRCFYVGVTVGLGASPVLARFGWRLVGWNHMPYANSLAGMPMAGFEDKVRGGWKVPGDILPYEGEHIDPDEDTGHPWKRFCHLWVSDINLAQSLDNQLSVLVEGQLDRWRLAVITVFAIHGDVPWTLNLFQ